MPFIPVGVRIAIAIFRDVERTKTKVASFQLIVNKVLNNFFILANFLP